MAYDLDGDWSQADPEAARQELLRRIEALEFEVEFYRCKQRYWKRQAKEARRKLAAVRGDDIGFYTQTTTHEVIK